MSELKVTGFGIAELGGGPSGTGAFALAFEEHGQFESDLIVLRNQERTGRAREQSLLEIVKSNHEAKQSQEGSR